MTATGWFTGGKLPQQVDHHVTPSTRALEILCYECEPNFGCQKPKFKMAEEPEKLDSLSLRNFQNGLFSTKSCICGLAKTLID